MNAPVRRISTAILFVLIATVGAVLAIVYATRDSDDRVVIADPFSRPATPSDRLPAWKPISEELVATRRVASYKRNGRTATLYVGRTRSRRLCLILVADQAAGGGCGQRSYRPAAPVALSVSYGLNYASGVVREDVRWLVVVGTRGGRHRISVSEAGGFIYRCPAYSGCAASVRSIQAYDGEGRWVGGHAVPGTA